MPSLTDVDLPDAFYYKDDVTITGSTHFIPPHPQTSAPFKASSISPISHPNQHSSFQQTPLRTQTRRLTMITTMLTPHHRTLLVHCEPLSVVTHVKHMSAELTHHTVPAAIEEAVDEEDDAIAGLGGCVREERIEEFDARQTVRFAVLFRLV